MAEPIRRSLDYQGFGRELVEDISRDILEAEKPSKNSSVKKGRKISRWELMDIRC